MVKNNTLIKQTDFLIGLLYISKKDYKKALFHLKRCEDTIDIKLKQKINIQFGICYKELGDYKNAISYFSIAREISANENTQVLAISNIADTYFVKKSDYTDLESAEKIYTDLINLHPNHDLNIEWRKKKANTLRQMNKDEEAILTLSKINDEDQTEWEWAQLEIGAILMSASPPRFSVAAIHYKTILDKITNPVKKEETTLNYGICLLKNNQGVDALGVFQRLILGTTNEDIIADAYQYLAICFEKENDIKSALEKFEVSLSKYPNQKNKNFLHKECVRLYQLDQNIESAIKHLNVVYLEVTDPNSQAEALFQLAGYDLKSGVAATSEAALEKLKNILKNYSKSPTAPKAAYLLGQININNKKFEAALPFFEKIIAEYKDPDLIALSQVELGNYYYSANEFSKAINYYKNITLSESAEQPKKYDALKESILIKKADCQFQLKLYPTAKEEYMNLIRLNQNNSFFKIRYSKSCLESKVRLEDAISLLEKIPNQEQSKETEILLDQLKELQQKIKRK